MGHYASEMGSDSLDYLTSEQKYAESETGSEHLSALVIDYVRTHDGVTFDGICAELSKSERLEPTIISYIIFSLLGTKLHELAGGRLSLKSKAS